MNFKLQNEKLWFNDLKNTFNSILKTVYMHSLSKSLFYTFCIPIFLLASDAVLSKELTTSEVHHSVNCPDPVDTPCIMKRPFNSMDYTLFTKDVNISEGNGVWIVNFPKNQNKINRRQIIRVMDFYGEAHVIEITIAESTKSETTARSPKPGVKNIVQEKKNNLPSKEVDGKPISLEKYISK